MFCISEEKKPTANDMVCHRVSTGAKHRFHQQTTQHNDASGVKLLHYVAHNASFIPRNRKSTAPQLRTVILEGRRGCRDLAAGDHCTSICSVQTVAPNMYGWFTQTLAPQHVRLVHTNGGAQHVRLVHTNSGAQHVRLVHTKETSYL